MRYIFVAAVFFLFFSCKGMPETETPEDTGVVSEQTQEETDGSEQTDDSVTDEDIPAEEEQTADSGNAESDEGENDITSMIALGADTKASEDDSSDTEAEDIETPPAQVEQSAPEPPPVQTPPPTPPVAQTQTTPPAQLQPSPPPAQEQSVPAAQTPSQSSSSSSSTDSSSLQPPIQIPSQSSQTIPPAPRQSPPAPPPALLGPAEEITPPSSRAEPVRDLPFAPQADIARMDSSRNGDIVFSRVVYATVGQTIEIPFTGTGWVYLGELSSQRGIAYNSRRLDAEGQSFIFRAEETGTFALKFFKENFVGGYILNDHVQVIVDEAPAASGPGWASPPVDRGRVVAQPRWPSSIEEAAIRRGSLSSRPAAPEPQTSSSTGTASTQATAPSQPPTGVNAVEPSGAVEASTPPSASISGASSPPAAVNGSQSVVTADENAEVISPDDLIKRAKEEFDGGNAAGAIALLDQLMRYYPSGTDELYWLYGQFYEANTTSRNILLSLDYYRRLVDEYPQSSRLTDARRRIVYLERFYINIQ